MEKKTILVVDDNDSYRLLCQEFLAEEGYDVVLAKNGKEALEKLELQDPDLVILDIVMPAMDGMEALPQMLRKKRTVPVIINTAYPHYRQDFMTWAADAYVMKSSDFNELKATVNELLSKPRLEVQ
jgi:DNA-binding response OmpR family regulator